MGGGTSWLGEEEKSFETFPLLPRAGDSGTAWRCAVPQRQNLGTPDRPTHRRGRLFATRRSSDAPIPDQPSRAASPASREDFTPKPGRTPCTPPSPQPAS